MRLSKLITKPRHRYKSFSKTLLHKIHPKTSKTKRDRSSSHLNFLPRFNRYKKKNLPPLEQEIQNL